MIDTVFISFRFRLLALYFLLAACLCLPQSGFSALQRIPDPPAISAIGYILVDANSEEIIAKNNANERMEPASLTKLMASYIVASALKQGKVKSTDMVKISDKAWNMKGSRMFVRGGTSVELEKLVMGMVVQSGNDATIALAEHIAGDEESFVKMMNETAQKLQLLDTHFANATGLSNDDHYSTPRDMTMLGLALIRDFPEHYERYSVKEYTYNGVRQFNRNQLLWKDKTVDGIRTGYTDAAGYCLVASAKRGSMRLISTVLGTKSEEARLSETQKLLTYGFRFFETHKLYSANDELTQVKIWKGSIDNLPLGLEQDLYITIPRGQYDKLEASMNITSAITAPVAKGEVFGNVVINLGSKQVARRDLVSFADVDNGSFWHNLIDTVRLWIKNFRTD